MCVITVSAHVAFFLHRYCYYYYCDTELHPLFASQTFMLILLQIASNIVIKNTNSL